MPARRERLLFACALLGLYLLFLVQAWNTPVILDDWYQLTYWRHHDFGLAALWEYGSYNYFHFNPRIGDVLLAIVNGPRGVHLLLTPLVQLAVLPTAFAIAFGRWPRATLRDLQLLLFIQVALWIVIPIPGVIYFYRPFATNYLWAFTITLALFLPYRFALASPGAPPAHRWLVPVMLPLGWLAGMCNEHTGPTAMVAIAGLVLVAWRRHRLRAWMLAGAIGLYIGYPMLFFAPGQAVRYAGLATRNTPLVLLRDRGLDGCFEIVLEFLDEAKLGLLLFAVAVLVYHRAHRRAGTALPTLSRATLVAAVTLILACGSILVTLFASPTASERLFYASGVLLVAALAALVEPLLEQRASRRFLAIACTAIFGYHAVRFVETYVAVKAESDERIAILDAAPDNTVAHVPPYDHKRRTRWHHGDDFRYASLRQYVGNEVFDLAGIELDRHTRWAQPSPVEHFVGTRTYDPPLAADVADRLGPVRYVPSYWEWAVAQLRRLIATQGVGEHAGHRLVRYVVTAVGTQFEDPQGRPVVVVDWTPTGYAFVDGRAHDDELRRPAIRIWQDSMPARVEATYIVGCGKTRRVEPVPDPEGIGPLLPVSLDCRGNHLAIVCEPDRCWLAGRYWR